MVRLRDSVREQVTAGASLIVIDYLQLLERSSPTWSRADALGIITGEMKSLAKDCAVPIVAQAQSNRSGQDDPRMSHLKDSGDIEADVDAVILLHHHPKDASEPGQRLSDAGEFRIAKNRQGDTGAFEAVFHGPTFTWTITDEEYPPLFFASHWAFSYTTLFPWQFQKMRQHALWQHQFITPTITSSATSRVAHEWIRLLLP
jgi:hypothetical protein